MKFLMDSEKQTFYMSLPVRGAWVEMTAVLTDWETVIVSLPVRGAWVEMTIRSATCL